MHEGLRCYNELYGLLTGSADDRDIARVQLKSSYGTAYSLWYVMQSLESCLSFGPSITLY